MLIQFDLGFSGWMFLQLILLLLIICMLLLFHLSLSLVLSLCDAHVSNVIEYICMYIIPIALAPMFFFYFSFWFGKTHFSFFFPRLNHFNNVALCVTFMHYTIKKLASTNIKLKSIDANFACIINGATLFVPTTNVVGQYMTYNALSICMRVFVCVACCWVNTAVKTDR